MADDYLPLTSEDQDLGLKMVSVLRESTPEDEHMTNGKKVETDGKEVEIISAVV